MAGVLTVVFASREYLVVVSSGLLGGFSVCLVGPAAGVVPVRETVHREFPSCLHLALYRIYCS